MNDTSKLKAVKILHTIVWAAFALSIVAIPVLVFRGSLRAAWALIGFVFIEVVVLAVNRMRCPLTDVAARYTDDRRDNFDIYLPLFVARWNKFIFGLLYAAGVLYALAAMFAEH